ncbi:hypothetical protein KTU01_12550 [Kocuria turfanensis]|uniref:Uncharacterized protein n=1 Tax=Kocuria turfanensis TaxID=388357 RepID=A0A512IBQ8_9MICC|nr:hypothetical protein KTU01_12550 [Kocuria turfanensis]
MSIRIPSQSKTTHAGDQSAAGADSPGWAGDGEVVRGGKVVMVPSCLTRAGPSPGCEEGNGAE